MATTLGRRASLLVLSCMLASTQLDAQARLLFRFHARPNTLRLDGVGITAELLERSLPRDSAPYAFSDSLGLATLHLPTAGLYLIAVSKPGAREILDTLNARPGLDTTIDDTLDAGGTLCGEAASTGEMVDCYGAALRTADSLLSVYTAAAIRRSPSRRTAIRQRVAHWRQVRDRGCRHNAVRDWGGGSGEVPVELACLAQDTRERLRLLWRLYPTGLPEPQP